MAKKAEQQRALAVTPDDAIKLQNGIAKLVLTIVELLRQVLERQALRRLESEDLSRADVERLGRAFLDLKTRIEELSKEFGIREKDLAVTLGSLLKSGRRELDDLSLVDVLDTLIQKGVVVAGHADVSVADVDLIGLDLYAVLRPLSKREIR
jgi:hypothetical protein